jgi:ribosomal subunit interface protein
MTTTPAVMISFKDIETDEEVRDQIEKRCRQLAEDFPETTKFEITLEPDGAGHTAHGHVTGRATELATHAAGMELGQAADRLLDKLARQLRRVHDKKIFNHRRSAQRASPKNQT